VLVWHEHMHGNICDTHQVHDIDELKQCVKKHGLGQSVISDAMDEWHKRLWACVHVKGGHFEHLMIQENTYANVQKQIYDTVFVTYVNSIAIVVKFEVQWEV